MDPFTKALRAGVAAQSVASLAGAGSQFMTGRALRLSDEQKRRLKELERLEALNEFGMTQAQREQYKSQALTPIQAAERQALAQFGASQSIGDIGQGAAFRQQQAIKEGSEESRAKIATAMAQQEQQAATMQAQQLASLKAQEQKSRQLQRDAAFGAIAGVAGAVGKAAGTKAKFEAQQALYAQRLAQLTGSQQYVTTSTQNMFGFTPNSQNTFGITPNSEKTPEERIDLLGQPPAMEMPAFGGVERGGRELMNTEEEAQQYDTLQALMGVPTIRVEGAPFNPLVTPQEQLDAYDAQQLEAQPILPHNQGFIPAIGSEIKSAEGWGYKVVSTDSNGYPVFTFVKRDGSNVGNFGFGTEQYKQAFDMLGGE